MASLDQPPGSLPLQQQQLLQYPMSPQPVATESSQNRPNQTESGLPPLPHYPPSWTDLTSPGHVGSGQTKQDFPRHGQSGQTSTTQPAIPSQHIHQLPLPTPEAQQQQLQQFRSQNGVQPALPAEAVRVPHTIGQMGSHVFPIANGQYQIRVISYMEVLIPMVPCPARPPPR